MAGKGDSPRPMSVTREEFDRQWKETFGEVCKKCDGKGYLYWEEDYIVCPDCNGDKDE